jgi:hypothetical protein
MRMIDWNGANLIYEHSTAPLIDIENESIPYIVYDVVDISFHMIWLFL